MDAIFCSFSLKPYFLCKKSAYLLFFFYKCASLVFQRFLKASCLLPELKHPVLLALDRELKLSGLFATLAFRGEFSGLRVVTCNRSRQW